MLDWVIEQFTISADSILIYGNYNPWLVALSIFIAIFASFMGLQVAAQAKGKVSALRRHSMLGIGSVALGGGIWSMHFIGMLAFDLCTTVEYDGLITFLSMLPGIFASWVALNYINSHRKGFLSLLIGGVLVGAGIGTMHYSGMAAMEMAPLLRYEPWMFALSIVVAVTLAMLSLWIYFGLTLLRNKGFTWWHPHLWASIVMGCAITGMHYTGMAAARFVRPPGLELSKQTSEISIYLALGISITTIVIICLVLGLNMIYRYKDISRKAAESEHRMRAMMDTAVDGIISIDSTGTILSINQATEQLLGWTSTELIGQNVKVIVPSPYHEQHDNYIQRYLATGEANIIGKGREVEAVHKDGSGVAIRLGIGHVKLSTNDFFVAFISDIRPRIRMERALRENEEKYRSLITNISGIAYRCKNVPGRPMIFISDAVEDITGYPPEDFLLPSPKRRLSELVHPDDIDNVTAEIALGGAFNIEYRIVTRSGDIRWMIGQGRHVQGEEKNETWIDGFIMDITERRVMEEELRTAKESAEQAASARASFMANMSHEIRTPMNAIIGFSDILLESGLAAEPQRHLKTINNSAKSLLHLLNDILDSAKLDKGKLDLEIRDFSLIQEVDEVVSTLWLQARSKGLELTVDVSPKLKKTYAGSPERVRQVLTNLVSNAVKFTQQGYVKITVSPAQENNIEFVIEDSGIGMSKSQLSAVFDPFTQADASMSRRFGGTGLGTTISKQLVELMGGKISATSEENKGSTFRFTLPLQARKNLVVEQKQERIKLPPMTILVVDDIQQNIDLLSVLLEREGHTVLTARDGQQALIRMAAETNLDLVIMDVQMPIMDGLTAARERRKVEQEEGLDHIPIIAFTASVLDDDRVAAKNAGMDGFANKPVDIFALFNEAARVLGVETYQPDITEPEEALGKLIDEKKGVALWGSKEGYYQELVKFTQQYPEDFTLLTPLCEAQSWQELKALAHKLKGVCGNLSLISLMRHLEKLEAIITSHPAQSAPVIDAIQAMFDAVKAEVEQEGNAVASTEGNLGNAEELIDTLQTLKAAAQQNEIDEQALLKITDIQEEQCFQSELNAINQSINDFEFTQAVALIEDVLNRMANR
ncbi:MHYT domain-containing protein [Thalassotalea sp. 1_MG-2023]|uniref:MHYT domain-containing protein n=1 Tax=Thalassotalea sp. 1_MG-2023 TaxID=3062680 RepID=UPI0026E2A89B|nr:MHYT domain-containing protein [Thalassotalea sp. 1_MG-2023]MDO6428055.1 MHYT domain-containing protein [Thalassotalea sp. 1_MG-2023]